MKNSTDEEMLITSVHNPKVKQLLALQQKSSERRKTGLFVVEGLRELTHCLEGGYEVESVFCCEDVMGDDASLSGLPLEGARRMSVSRVVYDRIAYRGSTEGVVAVIRSRKMSLTDIQLRTDSLIIVVESVEKPGNLGAMLRSPDAAGADALIVCDPLTDLFNPNLIRSSVGTAFTVPTVACTSEECIAFLKDRGIKILTAQLQDSRLYYDTDMRKATAIVMGTEATGLTNSWRQAADAHIRIPMLGRIDSLNVSVSAAILLFEAIRQRGGGMKL